MQRVRREGTPGLAELFFFIFFIFELPYDRRDLNVWDSEDVFSTVVEPTENTSVSRWSNEAFFNREGGGESRTIK